MLYTSVFQTVFRGTLRFLQGFYGVPQRSELRNLGVPPYCFKDSLHLKNFASLLKIFEFPVTHTKFSQEASAKLLKSRHWQPQISNMVSERWHLLCVVMMCTEVVFAGP